jgi:cell division protease FtsH
VALQRDCSERTARDIDEEVKGLLDGAYAGAKQILSEHRDLLELVARELLQRETLDATAFNALLGRPPVEADGEAGRNGAHQPVASR